MTTVPAKDEYPIISRVLLHGTLPCPRARPTSAKEETHRTSFCTRSLLFSTGFTIWPTHTPRTNPQKALIAETPRFRGEGSPSQFTSFSDSAAPTIAIAIAHPIVFICHPSELCRHGCTKDRRLCLDQKDLRT